MKNVKASPVSMDKSSHKKKKQKKSKERFTKFRVPNQNLIDLSPDIKLYDVIH